MHVAVNAVFNRLTSTIETLIEFRLRPYPVPDRLP
jgi:hypothetical protein